jgi:hypothetical protein
MSTHAFVMPKSSTNNDKMSSSSTTTSLHSFSFPMQDNTFSSTSTPSTYNNNGMLRQPGVSQGSSLARVPTAPPPGGGAMQRQPQYQTYPRDTYNGQNMERRLKPIDIQGGSLKTWTFPNSRVESVQVFLKTEGRPLNANLEVWQGPDNTPMQVAVYVEDGAMRPFSAVIGTPRDYPTSISVRNTATMEFPMQALLEPDREPIEAYTRQALTPRIPSKTVQGGAVYTIPFSPSVQSVAVLLRTDGRPLNTRIELLQGPNNNKQVMEVYSEDGLDRPFFTILETPGYGNVVRIVNTAVMEFPLTADIQPYLVDESYDEGQFLLEWENNNRNTGGNPTRKSNPYFMMNLL